MAQGFRGPGSGGGFFCRLVANRIVADGRFRGEIQHLRGLALLAADALALERTAGVDHQPGRDQFAFRLSSGDEFDLVAVRGTDEPAGDDQLLGFQVALEQAGLADLDDALGIDLAFQFTVDMQAAFDVYLTDDVGSSCDSCNV